MKSLCIESSQSIPQILLFDHIDHTLIDSLSLPAGQKHSSTLVFSIETLCKKANLSLKELSFISCGLGPGSFIGTRVGLITAKSLSFALDIPLVYFCSLEMYEPSELGPFLVLSDARSQGIYALSGVKEENGTFFVKEPILYSLEELLSLIDSKTTLLSPDSTSLQKNFPLPILPIAPSFSLLEKQIYQKKFQPSMHSLPFTTNLSC